MDLQEDYRIISNRESGFGRYDVMLEPKDPSKDAFILEFKVFKKAKEKTLEDTLEDTLASAHEQIEEKKYASELMARGFLEHQIHKYGFAFDGKRVLVG